MSKTIKINGTDFTKTFTPSGYTVAYLSLIHISSSSAATTQRYGEKAMDTSS